MTKENWVLGLDGCRAGWAGICWSGTRVVGVFGATVVSVVDRATIAIENAPIAVIGVDMFVGLPDHSVRQADALARLAIGPRRSSVFDAPVRTAIEATTYADALDINREMTGRGFSAQAFAMRKKALEIDRFVHDLKVPLIEVHPEVTFAQMNGEPLLFSKKTPAGLELRRQIVVNNGIQIPDSLGELGKRANPDDILDAAAVAWTAMRFHRGTAQSLPSPPEVFSDGLPAAIWF